MRQRESDSFFEKNIIIAFISRYSLVCDGKDDCYIVYVDNWLRVHIVKAIVLQVGNG